MLEAVDAGLNVGQGSGIGVMVGGGVGRGVGSGVGLGVGRGVGLGVGGGVEVGVAVGVGVAIRVGVGLGASVGVGLSVGVDVATGDPVGTTVGATDGRGRPGPAPARMSPTISSMKTRIATKSIAELSGSELVPFSTSIAVEPSPIRSGRPRYWSRAARSRLTPAGG
jgi:hypothetical protein